MKIASVATVKARLSAYLKASAEGPVVVTRNGKAVAVLIGVEDEDELERIILGHSRTLQSILDAAERRLDKGAGIPHEEFWGQVKSKSRGGQRKAMGKNGLTRRQK